MTGRGDFRWSPRTARGEVIHRAVALAAAGSQAEPRDLAWAAIGQALDHGGRSLSTWLRGLPEADRVAVAVEALPGIDGFLSAWPELLPAWRPVPEYPLAADLAGGRVHVAGRVDLSLGTARVGSDGKVVRRKLLLEIKSGSPNSDHRAEHLTYGLLETLQTRVAPWRAATFYVDGGTWVADDITQELLHLAAARLVAAVRRIVELNEGRKPTRQAGWRCGSCLLAQDCSERMKADEAGNFNSWSDDANATVSE